MTRATTRAAGGETTTGRSALVASIEGGCEVGFEAGKGGIEHFPARHDDDIKRRRRFVAAEDLARQALRAVAVDGRADLTRGGHTEARDRARAGQHEHGHEAAVDSSAVVVDPLELGPPANPFGGRERLA